MSAQFLKIGLVAVRCEGFQDFPCQVQSRMIGITVLQDLHDSQTMAVVFETAVGCHALIKSVLASMTKRRVTQIVRQCNRFGQIFV